jgi:hypothetical protein
MAPYPDIGVAFTQYWHHFTQILATLYDNIGITLL